jgi:hypothetical protein
MLGFLFGAYIYNNMRHIKLKDLINEQHKNNSPLAHLLEKDLTYLQERLIEEGLWDTIKQKVSGALEKTGEKTKELLIKPLVKVILDKIAKDDPKGFAQIQQYAQKDPENIQKLLDHPSIKKQQNKVEKELGSIQETLTEEQAEDFLQEYMDAVLEEARVLRDDPRNVARRARYAKRKADRLAGGNAPTPPKDADTKKEEPPAGDNIKKGAKQLGKGLGQVADKAGIWAIEKGGDAIKGAANLIGKGMDTKAGQAAKGAVGGLISKVYGWVKKNPKLSAGIGLGLLAAIFTAASIGSGGIVPLITSTLAAAGGGALKGGAIGGAIGVAKDAYSQIKGGKKSFKDMDYKQMAKSGLKAGGKGAAIGAAVGAGANVLGKAAAGISKIFSSGQAPTNPNSFLRDLTPDEQRALGIEGKTWAEKFNRNDMNTWKIKPAINSPQGYQSALKQNELLYKTITGQDAEIVQGTAALAAREAAAAKASKALELVRNASESDWASKGIYDQLRGTLGTVGQGSGLSQTQTMLNAYRMGTATDEQLANYFTKLAVKAASR